MIVDSVDNTLAFSVEEWRVLSKRLVAFGSKTMKNGIYQLELIKRQTLARTPSCQVQDAICDINPKIICQTYRVIRRNS